MVTPFPLPGKTGQSTSNAIIGGIFAVCSGFIAIIAVIGFLMFGDYLLALCFGLGISGMTLFFALLSRSSIREARTLPSLPPEQIAALPADQILVRGSEEPATIPEELLRAATKGTAIPSQELLRADQVEAGEESTKAVEVQRVVE